MANNRPPIRTQAVLCASTGNGKRKQSIACFLPHKTLRFSAMVGGHYDLPICNLYDALGIQSPLLFPYYGETAALSCTDDARGSFRIHFLGRTISQPNSAPREARVFFGQSLPSTARGLCVLKVGMGPAMPFTMVRNVNRMLWMTTPFIPNSTGASDRCRLRTMCCSVSS
jgi:hypothetical protein